MKQVLWSVLVFFFIFSQGVQAAGEDSRKAFFMQGNVGYGLSDFSKEKNGYALEFWGSGIDVALKFGLCFGGLWSIHTDIGFVNYDGDWEYEKSGKSIKTESVNDFFHVSLGIGGSLFPFKDKANMLKGLFFGTGLSFSMLRSDVDDGKNVRLVAHDTALSYDDGVQIFLQESAITWKLEVGETWPIGSGHWSVGAVLSTASDFVYATKYEEDSGFDYTSWSIGLAAVIMRR